MTKWHKCKSDKCTFSIHVENPDFPYCNSCIIEQLNKLEYPIKSKTIQVRFSDNELDAIIIK